MGNYVSAFDRIDKLDSEHQRYRGTGEPTYTIGEIFEKNVNLQKFNGRFEQLLFELEGLSDQQVESLKDLFKLALHPPRIVNAAVDYKIENPSNATESLVKDTIQFGLQAYRGLNSNTVHDFMETVKKTDARLLRTKVTQKPSECDAVAMAPFRSDGSAGYIANRADGSDILFIAVAHGGVPTGMDVYLRYCDVTGSKDSTFYVARLSTRKLNDKEPQLTKAEMDYLGTRAKGKHLVLFDGDRYTGNTLKTADKIFSDTLPFKGKTITGNYQVGEGHRFYHA